MLDSWPMAPRTLLAAGAGYVGLILILRLAGKRALSRLNTFDLIVTVALGSTLATTILSQDVGILEGLLALGALIALQWIVAWVSARWPGFHRAVTSSPALLVHDGRVLEDTVRSERVGRADLEAIVRSQGVATLEDAGAVILETNGEFSVFPMEQGEAPERIAGIDRV